MNLTNFLTLSLSIASHKIAYFVSRPIDAPTKRIRLQNHGSTVLNALMVADPPEVTIIPSGTKSAGSTPAIIISTKSPFDAASYIGTSWQATVHICIQVYHIGLREYMYALRE